MRTLDRTEAAACEALVSAVSFCPGDYGAILKPEWAASFGCEVVPMESAGRLPIEQIPRIASALSNAGYTHCYGALTETLRPAEPALLLETTVKDFTELNARYGIYRFVIVPHDKTWAVACNERFNLIGATPTLLEQMLPTSPAAVRATFDALAARLGGSLRHVASLYRPRAAR